MVIAAHDGDVLHKPCVIAQVLRDECAPLTVQLAARGVREKRAHLPLLDVRHGVDLIGKHLPVLSAVHAEAAIHGKSDEKDLAQLVRRPFPWGIAPFLTTSNHRSTLL